MWSRGRPSSPPVCRHRRNAKFCVLSKIGHIDFLVAEIPQHLDQRVRQCVEVDVEFAICHMHTLAQTSHLHSTSQFQSQLGEGLTLNIILGIRILRLVIMHHLHNLQ